LIGSIFVLVQQNVQSLFEYSGLWKFYFCVLLIGGVDDRRATNFGHLFSITVKGPTANFTGTDHVFDEEYPTTESQ
jgi:hypothetical protein